MSRYILRRVVLVIPTLIGISILVFFIVRLAPGTIIDLMQGLEGKLTPEGRARLERQFGLDVPMPVQYARWLGEVLQGDLGESWRTGRPISQSIKTAIPYTVELAVVSLFIAVVVAMPLGVISAVYHNTWWDFVSRIVSMLGLSFPVYWLAIMLILISSTYFDWLPPIKFVTLLENPGQNLQQMVLPSLALALVIMAIIMRFARSSVLEILGQDHVRTARAKGLPELIVLGRHAVRNALIPVVTVVGLQMGYLMGGTVIIEQIFGMPGLGWLLYRGVTQRDYPTVQATTLIFAVSFVLINLLVDIIYAYLDPRIRYE